MYGLPAAHILAARRRLAKAIDVTYAIEPVWPLRLHAGRAPRSLRLQDDSTLALVGSGIVVRDRRNRRNKLKNRRTRARYEITYESAHRSTDFYLF